MNHIVVCLESFQKIRGECGDKFDNPSENPLGDKLPSGPDVAIEASEWFKELRT